jgi:hypothetical protein
MCTPLGGTSSNVLARTLAQKHLLDLVKPVEGILHEIQWSLVIGGIGGIKKELKKSARTEDCAVENATLSGCWAAQSVAQDSEDKDGQPLHLLASLPGDLTISEAWCHHAETRRHQKPEIVEPVEAPVTPRKA